MTIEIMEPHPVPQDILNIEFKLFGAFSLSQFVKMVVGCLIGLFFFLIPMPSILIKLPLVVGPIVVGIGIAMVPRFAEKFENFLKAVFISPRYIWVKHTASPEFLKGGTKVKTKGGKKKRSKNNSDKFDIEEVSLDRMIAASEKSPELQFSSGSVAKDQFDMQPREQNLDRVYDSLFQDSRVKQAANKTARSDDQVRQTGRKSPQQIQSEIYELKKMLSNIVKDERHKEKEAEILSRINDLYHDLKMMGIEDVPKVNRNVQPVSSEVQVSQKIVDFKGKADDGQEVTGIVVDKKDNPISNAEVYFDLKGSEEDITVQTDSRGRFSSNSKILPGEYDISINHPEHKFHTYKIRVSEEKPPAYKLRSK